jgi:hypothetical protein
MKFNYLLLLLTLFGCAQGQGNFPSGSASNTESDERTIEVCDVYPGGEERCVEREENEAKERVNRRLERYGASPIF